MMEVGALTNCCKCWAFSSSEAVTLHLVNWFNFTWCGKHAKRIGLVTKSFKGYLTFYLPRNLYVR